ncbi:MAG: UDP-N-acetylmuramate dehydrogenase [Planctomycetota bacterium]
MKLKLPCPTRTDVGLAPLTTFKMGGKVPLLAEPRNREEFVAVIRSLREEQLTFRILGGGANVLVDDRGLDDVVVLTNGITFMLREGEDTRTLRLGAGLSIPQFVQAVRQMGRTGVECLVGIPGSIGGATVMNAGGRHGQFSDIARRVSILTPESEEQEHEVTPETFGYRRSIFGGEVIVLETVVELEKGDRDRSDELIRQYLKEKSLAQPLTERSAGCVFKNPPGDSAGRILDRAGAKGMSRGGAAVSEKHANFLVNRGGATLADVRSLIEEMQQVALEKCGIELQTEVLIWDRER